MSDRTPEQRAADRREIEKLHPGERFQMMLDAPTPETDAYIGTHETHRINGLTIYDRAKQLERERNEKIADIQKAADEIDRWRKLARRENERALSLEEECNELRRERDEARKGDWYQACIAIATRLAPITKAPGVVDAVDEVLAERDQLRSERDDARAEAASFKENEMGAVVIMSAEHRDYLEGIESERDQLRARVAELEGARWEAVHSGYHWWIAEEKTGDLIEMIAGPESEIAQGIVKAHNLALAKKNDQ